MARPKKPTALLVMEGRSHVGKKEIAFRERGEKAMKTEPLFFESQQVKADKVAHLEFLRLRRLFQKQGLELVDALDQQVINRYCLEVSNTHRLQGILNRLEEDLETVGNTDERMKLYDLINKTNTAMSKNKDMLLKYEDRLFLNPAARIKAVPKSPPKDEKPAGIAAFMAKRAEG